MGSKSQYCENTLKNAVIRQFLHGSTVHFTSNIFVMMDVSANIMNKITVGKFVILILLIFVLCVLMDWMFYHECSIGLSGVVFGLVTWLMLSNRGISKRVAIDLGVLLYPSVINSKISFGGHAMGIVAGAICYGIIQ